MSRKERRDELLDQLKSAADEWYEREKARIEDEVSFMKSFMRGRTGSERLSTASSERMGAYAVDNIGAFLSGE